MQKTLHGLQPSLSDEDWKQFLDESEQAVDADMIKVASDTYHAKLQPIRDAVESQQMRTEMARRLSYSAKKSMTNDVPLVSGDRVICKNTQYVSKTGPAKFQTRNGAVREYRVISVSKGIVEVEEVGTGVKMIRHESLLKLMPQALPADDEIQDLALEGAPAQLALPQPALANVESQLALPQPAPANVEVHDLVVCDSADAQNKESSLVCQDWKIVPAKPNGNCFYECVATAEALRGHAAGNSWDHVDEPVAQMRQAVLSWLESWIDG